MRAIEQSGDDVERLACEGSNSTEVLPVEGQNRSRSLALGEHHQGGVGDAEAKISVLLDYARGGRDIGRAMSASSYTTANSASMPLRVATRLSGSATPYGDTTMISS